MPEIAVLDAAETRSALRGLPVGKNDVLRQLADNLMTVTDTAGSLFVPDLDASTINALRTKMQRRNVQLTVRKTVRNGAVGHVLIGRTVTA